MESEEYMNRKSRKQRREAEVSILIIIATRDKAPGPTFTHLTCQSLDQKHQSYGNASHPAQHSH